ncbi:MAG TPA: carboxypeptidase-like regulatory domain-containing protein, partial [Saprospiraceae bacterium]|nr:carboxypeptidase-like regulatory domain-containing protein [Saprospiraceae bacterium]
MKFLLPGCLLLFAGWLSAQNGIVRGNVFDKESGEPIIYGTVRLLNTSLGANTDVEGFFAIPNVPPGSYQLVATYVGYDSVVVDVSVKAGGIVFKSIYLNAAAIELGGVEISARKEQARADVQISKITVTTKQ